MGTVQTGYGENAKTWTIEDMTLDAATAAARKILNGEGQEKWDAEEFEQAYWQFSVKEWEEIEAMYQYTFPSLLEMAQRGELD